jgi:hypothetical protein
MKSTPTIGAFAIAAFVGGLALAMPAFAQLPATPTVPNSMSAAGSMAKGAMPAGCQGMIDKASSMMGTLQGAKKTSAMSEMSLAQSALSAGDQTSCMTHVNKVMGMLK